MGVLISEFCKFYNKTRRARTSAGPRRSLAGWLPTAAPRPNLSPTRSDSMACLAFGRPLAGLLTLSPGRRGQLTAAFHARARLWCARSRLGETLFVQMSTKAPDDQSLLSRWQGPFEPGRNWAPPTPRWPVYQAEQSRRWRPIVVVVVLVLLCGGGGGGGERSGAEQEQFVAERA